MEILKTTTIQKLISPNRGIVYFEYTESVGDCLQKLAQNGILSAPIMNSEIGQCLGSLDVLDLLAFVLSTHRDNQQQWLNDTKSKYNKRVIEALSSAISEPFLPIPVQTSLYDLIRNQFSQRIHRAPIVADNEMITILSQSDICQFIQKNLDSDKELFELGNRTLSQLGFVPGNVLSVRGNVSLKNAFDYIYANSIGGVAVVNKDDQLIANLSASDCKGIVPSNVVNFDLPVAEYLKGQMPISCKRDTTFRSALTLFVNLPIHRVYIIDDSFNPIGLVTLTDVMKVISK